MEPVIGEFAAQLDLHTAQLRRVNAGTAKLVETIGRQSDDITFLLRGQFDQREQQTKVNAELTKVKAGQVANE